MKHSARRIFRANSDKPTAPVLVQKLMLMLMLMLIAAGMLEHQHVLTAGNTEASSDEHDPVALAPSASGPDGANLALNEGSFWSRLPLMTAQ
jgi:hypothetical protein